MEIAWLAAILTSHPYRMLDVITAALVRVGETQGLRYPKARPFSLLPRLNFAQYKPPCFGTYDGAPIKYALPIGVWQTIRDYLHKHLVSDELKALDEEWQCYVAACADNRNRQEEPKSFGTLKLTADQLTSGEGFDQALREKLMLAAVEGDVARFRKNAKFLEGALRDPRSPFSDSPVTRDKQLDMFLVEASYGLYKLNTFGSARLIREMIKRRAYGPNAVLDMGIWTNSYFSNFDHQSIADSIAEHRRSKLCAQKSFTITMVRGVRIAIERGYRLQDEPEFLGMTVGEALRDATKSYTEGNFHIESLLCEVNFLLAAAQAQDREAVRSGIIEIENKAHTENCMTSLLRHVIGLAEARLHWRASKGKKSEDLWVAYRSASAARLMAAEGSGLRINRWDQEMLDQIIGTASEIYNIKHRG